MKALSTTVTIAFSLLTVGVNQTQAAVIITPTNLDNLSLGPAIIGPLGPVVPGTFTTGDGSAIGMIDSSVFCPVGTAQADCPSSSLDTYIYRHTVTPDVDNLTSFTAGFPVSGFTEVAGYDFGESGAAGGNGDSGDFEIVFNNDSDNTLIWNVADSSNLFFDRGETITFFWQSTIPPAGPIGSYTITNDSQSGTGRGPAPAPPVTTVPEPSSLVFLALGFFPFLKKDRFNRFLSLKNPK